MFRQRRIRLPTRERPVPAIVVGGFAANATDQASYSFPNLAISTAPDAQRVVFAWVFSSAAGTNSVDAEPVSCLIGGIAPALVQKWVRTVTNSSGLTLFAARIPGGATATVDLTFAVSLRRCACILASTITPELVPRISGVLTASTTTDISGTVLVPRTGFVAVHNQNNTAVANTFTFSGARSVEVVDSNIEGGTQMAAATLSASDVLTIASSNDAGMDAIWIGL